MHEVTKMKHNKKWSYI